MTIPTLDVTSGTAPPISGSFTLSAVAQVTISASASFHANVTIGASEFFRADVSDTN
jgi:hypothetical protein